MSRYQPMLRAISELESAMMEACEIDARITWSGQNPCTHTVKDLEDACSRVKIRKMELIGQIEDLVRTVADSPE